MDIHMAFGAPAESKWSDLPAGHTTAVRWAVDRPAATAKSADSADNRKRVAAAQHNLAPRKHSQARGDPDGATATCARPPAEPDWVPTAFLAWAQPIPLSAGPLHRSGFRRLEGRRPASWSQPLPGRGGARLRSRPERAAVPSRAFAHAKPRNRDIWRHANWPTNTTSLHPRAVRSSRFAVCGRSCATFILPALASAPGLRVHRIVR